MNDNSMRRRIISISGPSGAGKSFLVKKFTKYRRISTDDFYLGKSQMAPDENGLFNFDDPSAVDLKECADAVDQLATAPTGSKVTIPRYNMKTSERDGHRELEVPEEDAIIIVEGIFSFHSPLLEISNFRIFVEPKPEIILARRYKRDIEERERTPLSVLKQYPTVLEGFEKYIKPYRKYADLVIDFGILV